MISHYAMIECYFPIKSPSYYISFIMEELCSSLGPKMVLSSLTQHLLTESVNVWFSKKFGESVILLWGNM